MILAKGLRSNAFDWMKVLLREEHITFNENYTSTHLKTVMKISIKNFYKGYLIWNQMWKYMKCLFENDN